MKRLLGLLSILLIVLPVFAGTKDLLKMEGLLPREVARDYRMEYVENPYGFPGLVTYSARSFFYGDDFSSYEFIFSDEEGLIALKASSKEYRTSDSWKLDLMIDDIAYELEYLLGYGDIDYSYTGSIYDDILYGDNYYYDYNDETDYYNDMAIKQANKNQDRNARYQEVYHYGYYGDLETWIYLVTKNNRSHIELVVHFEDFNEEMEDGIRYAYYNR